MPFARLFPLAACCLLLAAFTTTLPAAEPTKPIKIAAIVTAYYHNSHADVLVSRLLETDTLDGQGRKPAMELASLYVDQFPQNDKSRTLAAKYSFRMSPTIADALTLGGEQLAVDGVLIIAEHGVYRESPTGSIQYPKRKFMEQVLAIFDKSQRVVPIFSDKHLSDNWSDAKWTYDECQKRKIPLMAGSSLPGLWRYPPRDVPRDAEVKEFVAVSFHRLDTYGFHALEMVQCLAERRKGGETGVKSVQCLEGEAVWEAGRKQEYDPRLLAAAFSRFKERPPVKLEDDWQKRVPKPYLFRIDYRDGLKATILTLDYAVGEWSVAWRDGSDQIESTLFWTQEARPFAHFGFQLAGVERMMQTGRATWPAERTLMTSGMLDALLLSKKAGGVRRETPELDFAYKSDWNWSEPPPPPKGRPIPEQ